MRIVWVTNSPAQPTGFGQQAGLIIKELMKRGHTCEVICRPHVHPKRICAEHHLEVYQWETIDAKISELRPDAVICFEGHKLLVNLMSMRESPANCPVYFWFPFEGSAVPEDLKWIKKSREIAPFMVHLSNFAAKMWKGKTVIPHAVNPAFRKLETSKIELRRKWIRKYKLPLLENALTIVNCNRNFFHKGWDELFQVISLVKDSVDVQLLCKTTPNFPETLGGFDLKNVAKLYGVQDHIIFVDQNLSVGELNEFYNLADLRIDLSHGEGFGLCPLECKAAGTPQIVTNHTTMPEILADDLKIEPAIMSYRMGTLWAQPDVRAVAQAVRDWNSINKYDPQPVAQQYTVGPVVDLWEALLAKPTNQWRDYRFGLTAGNGVIAANQTVAKLCRMMNWSPVQIAAYDGSFLQWCETFAVKATGVETVENSAKRPHKSVKLVESYLEPWPAGDTLVLTNAHDIILGETTTEELTELLKRICSYPVVLLLDEPCFKWGKGRFNSDQLKQHLKVAGLSRQFLLESKTKKKMPEYTHEIWSASKLDIPEILK